MKRNLYILLILLALLSANLYAKAANIQDGKILLKKHNFKLGNTYKLDGYWEFYWEKFITPESVQEINQKDKEYIFLPGCWSSFNNNEKDLPKKGFASYRRLVLLESDNYFIKFPTMQSASVIWINGKKIKKFGVISDKSGFEKPQIAEVIIPVTITNDSLEIIINNSNFHHARAGMKKSIEIGGTSFFYKNLLLKFIYELSIILLSLIVGIFHLIVYFLKNEERKKTNLFFGILAIVFSIRLLIINSSIFYYLFPFVSYFIRIKIEWIIAISQNWLGLLFIIYKFKKESVKVLNKLFLGIGLLITLFIFLLNTYLMTSFLIVIYIFSSINILYMIFIIFRAYLHKKEDSRLLFYGLILLLIMLLLEFYFQFHIGFYYDLLTIGFMAILVSHSANLIFRLLDISKKLDNYKNHLEEIIHQRTKELEESKIQLETRVHQTLMTQGKLREFNDKLTQQIKITKSTQEALISSEKKFRELSDLLPEVVYETDFNLNFTYVNQKAIEIFGYSLDEFYNNMNATQLLEKEYRNLLIQSTYKSSNDPLKSLNDYVFITKSGQKFIGLINGKPIYKNEKIVGFRGIVVDITSLRRNDEKIKKLQGFLFNIIDSMPSIMIGVNKEMTITLWNKSAEYNYNFDHKKAHHKYLFDMCPGLKEYEDKIIQSIESGQIISIKMDQDKYGRTKYKNMTLYPLLKMNAGAVIKIDDITEQVKMEEMLVQSEKMLSIGGLAAGMAHEINNPLAGMVQNAQVISNRIKKTNLQKFIDNQEDIEKISGFISHRKIDLLLQHIIKSGLRAAQIVSNMLSFAKQGKMTIYPEDFNELLEETLELVKNDYNLNKKYDFKKVKIIKNYQSDMGKVYCEKSKIQQVILNLVKNSAEANIEKSTDENFQPTLELTTKKIDGDLVFEISDNGPGIPENIQNRIFEPFFTTKSHVSGTGLGLSVSYFIITKNHGGKMLVDSNPGQGTKFTIIIPFNRT